MDIHTYGVTTSRYDSCLTWGESRLLVPVGPTLCLWNLETLSREKVFHYNSNAVMSLIQNTKLIFSICYNGEVAVIDRENLTLIKKFQAKGRTVRHNSVNDEYLAVSGETGSVEGGKGITEVFTIESVLSSSQPEPILSLEGRYRFCHILEGGRLYTLRENVLNQAERDEWNMLKKQNPGLPREEKPKKKRNYYTLIYDIKSKEELHSSLVDHVSTVIASFSNGKDLCCSLYLDRTLVIFNANSKEVVLYTKFAGVGAILTGNLTNRNFYISTKRDHLLKINVDKAKDFPPNFDFEQMDHEAVTVKKMISSGLDAKNFSLVWQKVDEVAIICFEGEFNVINFTDGKVKKNYVFEITCCGLALSNNTKYVACGDFAGNVNVFSTESCLKVEPLYKINIMECVRALIFDSKDNSIIIGTLGGKLLRWFFQESLEAHTLAHFDHGIIHLEYNNMKEGNNFLLAGIGSGMFIAFKEIEYEPTMHIMFAYHGHLPNYIPNNIHFGSLHKFAEIWSTCWSPTSNDLVVTASEDQTCIVWDLSQKNPKLLHKLTGHTKAVTSIDWKVMHPKIGEIFISCSDDQTARIYDPKNDFKLIDVISTSFINEWHTLTYLCLENEGTRIFMGAQNGFVFVYDLLEKKFIYAERFHQGSVEGVDWKGDTIVTCSADNSVSIIKLPKLIL